jgi:hypothetical protein
VLLQKAQRTCINIETTVAAAAAVVVAALAAAAGADAQSKILVTPQGRSFQQGKATSSSKAHAAVSVAADQTAHPPSCCVTADIYLCLYNGRICIGRKWYPLRAAAASSY